MFLEATWRREAPFDSSVKDIQVMVEAVRQSGLNLTAGIGARGSGLYSEVLRPPPDSAATDRLRGKKGMVEGYVMKVHLYVFTIFLGIVLAVHLAMNGKVGSVIGNARVANALFWCIGAFGAVIIGLTGWQSGALQSLKQVHPALLTAGVLGASLVFAIAWLIPQVGAGTVMITLLAGQVMGGLIMSHFGWLGSPVQPITLTRLLGVLVMIGGVVLATSAR